MKWNNELQKAIIEEWTEEVQKAKGPRAKLTLRRQIAEKYGLNVLVIQGIIELTAIQGMIRVGTGKGKGMQGPRKYEPINYHELVGDLKERIAALERKFDYLLDGIQKVLDDGETMAIHLNHLRQVSRWAKDRKAIDLDQSHLK